MFKSLREIAADLATDKGESVGYLERYEERFCRKRGDSMKLLELGVYKGGSLLMWREYFPRGLIVGLDASPTPFAALPGRVRFYQGRQDDAALLGAIAAECAPEGFDFIIDDAAHVGTVARASFQALFGKYLKPAGVYVVEDWGTGYWGNWADGAGYRGAPMPGTGHDRNFSSHNFGMVGFVKELVDHLAWGDITREGRGNPELADPRVGLIREISFFHGQVFITKA